MRGHAVMLIICIREAPGLNLYWDTILNGFFRVLPKENYWNNTSLNRIHFHQVTWRRMAIFLVLRFIPGGKHRFQLNRMLGVSKISPENSKKGSILPFLGNRPLALRSIP
jgi:hypothetical protein